MTGFGRGSAGKHPNHIVVTVKAYNARFLDVKIRGFALEPSLEMKIREIIQDELVRGTVYVTIELDRKSNEKTLVFNRKRFEAIENIAMVIQKEYGRHIDIGDLVQADDLLQPSEDIDVPEKVIIQALEQALAQVREMRAEEGARLREDLEKRLENFRELLAGIDRINRENSPEVRDRYRERVNKLLNGISLDEDRLAQEIAILAERTDITEEIIRSQSHLEQALPLLEAGDPVGKRFNFILQEMGREINTMGSKSNNPDMTNLVIQAKGELEKMREQIQNII
ncbi:MAG: YicC/YloC family endoribonuclease [Fidelibacterota bacterium]